MGVGLAKWKSDDWAELLSKHHQQQQQQHSVLLKDRHCRAGAEFGFQPRSQGLLLVQNGGRRHPWPRLLKYSKNRGVFCHVTYDEMAFSVVVSSVWRPCLLFCTLKRLFKQNEDISSCLPDKILMNFWSHFGSLGQGLL